MANPLEQLFGATFEGQPMTKTTEGKAGVNQWAGFGTINSGSATVTISAAAVQSGAIVLLNTVRVGSLGVNSGGPLVVTSIVDDTSFNVARMNGSAVAWDESFSFFIVRTTRS